jgi:hypothetical protein
VLAKLRNLIARIQKWAASLPPLLNAVVTSGTHGLFTVPFVLLGIGQFILGYYTAREVFGLIERGKTAPWYDHIADVAVPWAVYFILR